jgi:hypothetical protein
MAEIINFSEHQQRQQEKVLREKLISEMATTSDADYTLLQLLDLFLEKYHPEIKKLLTEIMESDDR